MNFRIHFLTIAAVLLQSAAAAAGGFNSNHPEEAYPDNMVPLTSGGAYSDLIKQVQTRLRQQGFDAGPVTGDFATKTQAALAQFQLSRLLPASGMLDDPTLAELGVQRETQASAAEQKQDGPMEVPRSDGGT